MRGIQKVLNNFEDEIFFWVLAVFPFFISCNNKGNSKQVATKDSSQFYPLGHFIQQQIDDVELRNFGISRINELNGKGTRAASVNTILKPWRWDL